MTNYPHHPKGHECPPRPECPADQPFPPAGDCPHCDPLPETQEPPWKDPQDEHPCPEPDPCCKCPTDPASSPNCLEELIGQQDEEIVAAEGAQAFKAELEAILAKAKEAKVNYTREKYEKLRDRWVKQDGEIAELIRKLECAVWCWKCILDCHVCPLLNEIHYAEKRLYNDGKLYDQVHDLYDLKYWRTRDKEAKERRFARIGNVLKAWESPGQTIEKVLDDTKAIIDSASAVIGSQPGKAIYDVFFKLVPLHLAIAPPRDSKWTTGIDKRYTKFCDCNQGCLDTCCGPDTGELSLRQRLIGPQPYLIDPNKYFDLICCLAKERYHPAKEALSKAEAALKEIDNRIGQNQAKLTEGLKGFEAASKAAIPSIINCCDYERQHEDNAQSMA